MSVPGSRNYIGSTFCLVANVCGGADAHLIADVTLRPPSTSRERRALIHSIGSLKCYSDAETIIVTESESEDEDDDDVVPPSPVLLPAPLVPAPVLSAPVPVAVPPVPANAPPVHYAPYPCAPPLAGMAHSLPHGSPVLLSSLNFNKLEHMPSGYVTKVLSHRVVGGGRALSYKVRLANGDMMTTWLHESIVDRDLVKEYWVGKNITRADLISSPVLAQFCHSCLSVARPGHEPSYATALCSCLDENNRREYHRFCKSCINAEYSIYCHTCKRVATPDFESHKRKRPRVR